MQIQIISVLMLGLFSSIRGAEGAAAEALCQLSADENSAQNLTMLALTEQARCDQNINQICVEIEQTIISGNLEVTDLEKLGKAVDNATQSGCSLSAIGLQNVRNMLKTSPRLNNNSQISMLRGLMTYAHSCHKFYSKDPAQRNIKKICKKMKKVLVHFTDPDFPVRNHFVLLYGLYQEIDQLQQYNERAASFLKTAVKYKLGWGRKENGYPLVRLREIHQKQKEMQRK